jgi:hypothetical protein
MISKYVAAIPIVAILACSPALSEEPGSPYFSLPAADFGNTFLQDDKVFKVAAASLTHADAEPTDGTTTKPGKKQPTQAEIAEAINNPLSSLWLLFTQNDTKWYQGNALDALNEGDKVINTTLIEPVMPIQLTQDWKMILRPVIPINSFDTLDGLDVEPPNGSHRAQLNADFDRKTGLGDIVLWSAFSNAYTPPNIFGFGPTVMMNTATDDKLGTGKWAAGPMALAFHVGDKWIYGAVAQHWWSFAGDGDRDDVNLTDIQYVLRYRLSPKTNIGFGPNIQGNWEADKDNRWTVPVGLGGDTLVKLGPLPVKMGLEAYYNVVRPDDFGPKWQIRLLFVPVIGAPEWSRTALF